MIKIVSDSSTLYSIKDGQANNIDIAPLSVTIDGKTYTELEDIQTREFIDIINKGNVPTSSQPSIGEVIKIYEKYKDAEIINISMADGLSGTYNSACIAKSMDENPDRIEVINSKTLCGPQRYLVELAVKLVEEGYIKEKIVQEINDLKEKTISFLIANDFDFLVRGGRLSPLVGKIGSAIKLVPVVILTKDGRSLDKFTTKRSFKKAIQKICDYFIENNIDESYRIYISHALNESQSEEAEKIIREKIENADVVTQILGPAFVTQGGPGCIAIQAIKKHNLCM